MTSNPAPTPRAEIKAILDEHAETYARATSQYIIHKITESERNDFWHKQDLKSLDQLLRLVQQAKIDIHLEYADKLEGRPRIEAMISAWELGHDREAIVPQWQIELEKSL